jgi:hypothetical protein
MTDIKSIKLYTHVERIGNVLAELGIGTDDEPGVEYLSAFNRNFQPGKLGGIRVSARGVE